MPGTGPVVVVAPDDRIAYANAAAAGLLGMSAETLVGRRWHVPDLVAQLGAGDAQLCLLPLAGSGWLLFADAGEGSVAAPSARETLPEMHRAACLARIDAIGRFSGGLAHDLNNLIGAVAGYADFLISDLPPGSPLADYAARIIGAVERTKDMARQMMVLSQAGAPSLRRVAPDRVLSATLALLRASSPDGIACCTVREDPDLPDLMGNLPMLSQALADLADFLYAMVRRSAGGASAEPLGLKVSHWSAGGEKCPWDRGVHAILPPLGQSHVLFELATDRTGMTIPRLSVLFDPFAMKSFETGNGRIDGLRLALVLAVVRGHDGGLVACTDDDRGFVFRLMIPAASPVIAADEGDPSARTGADLHRCRILVVDGDPATGDAISSELERCGHEVAVCESAEEALEVIEEEPDAFDAVVTDQSMPGMSGMLLIAELKARHPDLVCVLYSGSTRVANEARARRVGADAFYVKPFDGADLARRVALLVAERGRAGE